ncbi:IS256-like element IS1081 family transposase [Georgenia daeguensis]|uniref:Mutator family transposase n=1 Tax=Georgenia daeguensis TaxID=908355 RepID=A0ABP8EVM9_9MICO
MTAPSSIDPARFLHEHLAQASPDLMRDMLATFINALLSAEADAVCGAGYREVSEARANRRNGYRHRELDTRVGTVDVAIPKLRQGSYFPEWLLQRRRRAEAALTSVVATCYLLGVSTRRMDKLVQTLGITGLSKSQVSEMAKDLDAQVNDFRTRPLDAGPYTFLAADALTMKVREGGRVINVSVMVATGVNNDGHREVLGVQVATGETGAGWLAFFRDLLARGLTGVALVTSDAHAGLVEAIAATLPGAAWQRCRTHYAANLMATTPKASWPAVKAMLHSVYEQADAKAVQAQFDKLLDSVTDRLPKVAEHLEAARADILAFTAFPQAIWRQIWSNNPNERLNREIRPPHRRRRHLPRPRQHHPPRRRGPGRAARRMGRGPPLPRPRRPGQVPPDPPHRYRPQGGHHRASRRHQRLTRQRRITEPEITGPIHHSRGLDPPTTPSILKSP